MFLTHLHPWTHSTLLICYTLGHSRQGKMQGAWSWTPGGGARSRHRKETCLLPQSLAKSGTHFSLSLELVSPQLVEDIKEVGRKEMQEGETLLLLFLDDPSIGRTLKPLLSCQLPTTGQGCKGSQNNSSSSKFPLPSPASSLPPHPTIMRQGLAGADLGPGPT